MKINRFEDIEAWQLARELTRMVYRLTKKQAFGKDYGLKRQIEVQSELYVALDEAYISRDEFDDTYEKARRTRAAIRGFINYLDKSKCRRENPTVEP
jgi:hypothetical protein